MAAGPLHALKQGVATMEDLTRAQDVASADGAITIPERGSKTVVVTKAGVCAMTLAAPSTAHNGVRITFVSTTAQAHTLTVATAGFNDLGAAGDVGTFGAAKGNGLTVEAYNGDWYVVSNIGVTFG